jgi:hypothetical protein
MCHQTDALLDLPNNLTNDNDSLPFLTADSILLRCTTCKRVVRACKRQQSPESVLQTKFWSRGGGAFLPPPTARLRNTKVCTNSKRLAKVREAA